uniref:Uncharacterized protein n=1 Tax=Panagrolaimus superbus TaxID=310955 RepID=A0A914YMU5_9BILA
MNIIEKDKKEIRWVGLPTSLDQECQRYQEEKVARQDSIRKKTEQLQELVIRVSKKTYNVKKRRDVFLGDFKSGTFLNL